MVCTVSAVIDRAARTGMKFPLRRKAAWFGGRLGRSARARPPVFTDERRNPTPKAAARDRRAQRHVGAFRYSATRAPSTGHGGPWRSKDRMSRPC